MHIPSLPVLHAGAPNFRRANPYHVYGVAISTLDGIRAVLGAVGVSGGERVMWYNMREEVRVRKGRPSVVPFSLPLLL